jgi:hypothetical protein
MSFRLDHQILWAVANALGKPESEWLMYGRDVE